MAFKSNDTQTYAPHAPRHASGWIRSLVSASLLLGGAWLASAAGAQTVRAVMHSDVKVLDPTVSTAYIVRNHGFMVWDQLVARDEQGAVRPQMADRWEISPDKTVYTFTLREGLEWHDGKPVTSDDCIASIKRFLLRDATGLRMAPFVKGYDVINARTFRIVLKEPYGLVLDTLSKPSLAPLFMMPKAVAETSPADPIKPEQVIGSGPFIFKRDEWRPGERIVYVKNPRYRPRAEPPSGLAGGKVVHVDRVEWVAIPDGQTALAALSNGEVDLVETVSNELAPLVERDRRVVLEPGFQMTYFFRPNWVHPPFDNPRIRQAAMIALSQDQILKGMVGDAKYFRTCFSSFSCDSPIATDAGMSGMVRGDARRAAALLKEAGYDGTPVLIPHPTDLSVLNNLGPLAKQQLERAGFKVQLAPSDWQSMTMRLRKKDRPAEGGWSAYMSSLDWTDADNPIDRNAFNTNCKTSFLGWPCDDKMESLREAYSRALDNGTRKALARQIQERNAEIVAFIPLGEFSALSARSPRLERTFKQPIPLFWGLKKSGG
jgi:peptide/nickel transport system substrate-binding protein